mmetsp:Transcript_14265/g.54017  ORF Transcript_14265/g.54017 Transcript_14265/m.54017 type:complete len:252 (-) Transcript_14265:123-878(-)
MCFRRRARHSSSSERGSSRRLTEPTSATPPKAPGSLSRTWATLPSKCLTSSRGHCCARLASPTRRGRPSTPSSSETLPTSRPTPATRHGSSWLTATAGPTTGCLPWTGPVGGCSGAGGARPRPSPVALTFPTAWPGTLGGRLCGWPTARTTAPKSSPPATDPSCSSGAASCREASPGPSESTPSGAPCSWPTAPPAICTSCRCRQPTTPTPLAECRRPCRCPPRPRSFTRWQWMRPQAPSTSPRLATPPPS